MLEQIILARKMLAILKKGVSVGLLLGSHLFIGHLWASSKYVFGYLIIPVRGAQPQFNQGFSLYVPVWPLENYYPGRDFETGLPGTWMFANYKKPAPPHMYSDAEGGLGWWTNTRFPQLEPKFEIGGVGPNFSEIASGPDMGAGTWSKPRGKYAVAQLSPWLLFPPDEINLKAGQAGQLFGYGYMNLPLLPTKSTTDGQNVPTGGNCWTLFLNAKNFKGPVAFFLPYFWSHFGLTKPDLIGQLLDSRPMNPNMAIQMETHYIACAVAKASNGETYARIAPTSFPANSRQGSILVAQSVLYSKQALWNSVNRWFQGGLPSPTQFRPIGAFHRTFQGSGYSTWEISLKGPNGKDQKIPIDFTAFSKSFEPGPYGFGFRWSQSWVKQHNGLVTIPQYYQLKTNSRGKPMWEPIKKGNVPPGTGLKTIVWKTPKENPSKPLTTPFATDPTWQNPGPATGPYYAHLGDGTVVTYYWYKFEDQPALMHAGLTQSDRDQLQKKVELLQRYWTINKQYMAPPRLGSLASLDPGLIVHPPKRLGLGYVPIAVDQRLAKR